MINGVHYRMFPINHKLFLAEHKRFDNFQKPYLRQMTRAIWHPLHF